MKKILPGALAALLATMVLAAPPALAGPTVTVRVEGETATLLERTTVTLPDDPPYDPCSQKWMAAAAIEQATKGNWDRQEFVSTILGESHTFTQNDYWAEWVDFGSGYKFGNGICNDVLKAGDEVLELVDRSSDAFLPTRFPLDLEGVPTAIDAGKPVTVTVVSYVAADGTPGTSTRTPVEGATVSGGGVTAMTGAGGTAELAFATAGSVVVKATKPGSIVSAGERVDVSATPPPPCVSSGSDGRCGTTDSEPPTATIARLKNGKVFKHKRGPRRLSGRVTADPSGLLSVRLSILRKTPTGCWAFDGRRERFEPHRCGGHSSFRIGDRTQWSYLLPKRLPKGRYTIRAVAIDNAGNESVTRVVIRVR